MKIFVVVPFHNEERHVASVLQEISRYNLPVVLVDDGSDDASGQEVKKAKVKNIILLTHKINLGKGAALKTGAEYAFGSGADGVIFMDSDGQHKASDLPKFLDALKSGKFDVVFGSRNMGMGVPLVRYLGNKAASVISAVLFGTYVSDAICGFRALTKRGYQKIRWESNGYGVEMEMLARAGKYNVRHTEVPVETLYLNNVKGVTLLDAFGILGEVVRLKLTL